MACQIAFLLGAGRSGTTLLYKMLSLHPEVTFISNYDRVAPVWMPVSLLTRGVAPFPGVKRWAWFQSGGNANLRWGERSRIKRLIPSPVEGEDIYLRCGLPTALRSDYRLSPATVQCLRRRFSRIATQAGGKILLSKRTANNQRVPLLREIFPDARFIHMIRDGRAVAYSLPRVTWWPDHEIWWAGRTPRELASTGEEPLAICARNWVEDVRAVQAGLAMVPAEEVHELRFESLMAHPLDELRSILVFLGLSWSPKYEAAVRSLNLRGARVDWKTAWSEKQVSTVTREQHALLQELGYV
jgi:hypothetical protein